MPAYNECDGGNMNFWEKGNSSQQNQQKAQGQKAHISNNQSVGDMASEIARLNSMDEGARMAELMRTATKMQSNGQLNSADLERVYQTAGMFMNAEQLKKLRTLIDAIK